MATKTTYLETLERQLKEAQQEFDLVKSSALADLKDLDYYHAQDWGAAYYTKIDKITAAGTKVMTIYRMLEEYKICVKEKRV